VLASANRVYVLVPTPFDSQVYEFAAPLVVAMLK